MRYVCAESITSGELSTKFVAESTNIAEKSLKSQEKSTTISDKSTKPSPSASYGYRFSKKSRIQLLFWVKCGTFVWNHLPGELSTKFVAESTNIAEKSLKYRKKSTTISDKSTKPSPSASYGYRFSKKSRLQLLFWGWSGIRCAESFTWGELSTKFVAESTNIAEKSLKSQEKSTTISDKSTKPSPSASFGYRFSKKSRLQLLFCRCSGVLDCGINHLGRFINQVERVINQHCGEIAQVAGEINHHQR